MIHYYSRLFFENSKQRKKCIFTIFAQQIHGNFSDPF